MSGLELIINNMGNAAFAEDPQAEVCEILRIVSDRIASGETDGVIHDVNGNTVGHWSVDYPEDEEEEE